MLHNTYVIFLVVPLWTCLNLVSRSVFDAKRLIGRKFNDPELQSDIEHFPFKDINKGSKSPVRISYRAEDKQFVCHNLLALALINIFSAMVLSKMKDDC